MRILMLAPPPRVRGPIPGLVAALAAGLRAHGCSVASLPWGRHHDAETLRERLAGRLRDIARVQRRLRQERFDVVVVHTGHDRGTVLRDLALALALQRWPPLVLQFHGSYPDRLLAAERSTFARANRLLLRLVDAALVLSTEEQRLWRRFDRHGRSHVVVNPHVSRQPACTGMAASSAAADTLPVLLFVGRLRREKGLFDLIDALPAVLERAPCRLVIAGEGPDEATARRRAAALSVAGHVRFAGYLEGDALAAVYDAATILVHPSWSEGFPTVIAEAMDAGLPLVTTGIRGMADHLEDGVHALFVPPHNPTALAAALVRLLEDPHRRAAMSRANRLKVREFAPEIVARRYLDALTKVVAAVR